MKRRLRVLLAFDVEGTPATEDDYERYMETDEAWYTEGHVLATLRENGHQVTLGPIVDHPREIIDLVERVRPDVVWNSVETVRGNRYYESHVVAVLELLGVPITGCGLEGMLLCKDKALSKKILSHHRVPVPAFVVSRRRQPVRKLDPARFPMFVKPIAAEGSEGIARDSFAETPEQALRRARFLHKRMRSDVIIERYIEGRELYVGVLGNDRATVLAPRELRFTKVPEGEPTYASYKAKWDADYRERWGIRNGFAEDLDERTLGTIGRVAKRAYQVLRMRGYGRIDLRLAPDGRLFVMEANPNPEIAMYEDFAEGAARRGISYNDLIERVLRLALEVKLP